MQLKNTKGLAPNYLSSPSALLIVSEGVRDFLADSPEAPFLQFFAITPARRTPAPNYFIVNVVEPLECLDREASIFEIPAANPDVFISFDKMVIDTKALAGRRLFCMRGYPTEIFIEDGLAQELEDRGLNGLRLIPLIGSAPLGGG